MAVKGVGTRKPRDLQAEWKWSLIRIALGVFVMNAYNLFRHSTMATRVVDLSAAISTICTGWWLMTPSALSFTASALMSLVIHAGLWIYLRHDIGDIDAKKRMNIPSGAVFFLVALASMSVSNRFLGPQRKRKAR